MKENFELVLRQKSSACLIFLKLVLILIKANLSIKKESCKQVIVDFSGIGSSEIIFIWVIKMITFYMKLSIIKIRKLNL